MATISTSTYWDTATRTAGETSTVAAGATLTFRTDTRVHAYAPASMMGTIGSISCTGFDSSIKVDGTAVRWLKYDTGSGNSPAIGTTISQSGASGYFLGVWADLASAPITAGSAIPATGYIKFREVTGAFTAGALTGITANASSADVTGWIEIAANTGSTMLLGNSKTVTSLQVQGSWFYLDNTTGVTGQVIQTPTNGGGANSYCYGVQIETAPGSNVFVWYPTLTDTNVFNTSDIGTDARNKYVAGLSNGQVRIGNAAGTAGYVPVAGCRVRIPNIIFVTTASSATGSTNALYSVAAPTLSHVAYGSTISIDKAVFNWGTGSGFTSLTTPSTSFTNSVAYNVPSSGGVIQHNRSGSVSLAGTLYNAYQDTTNYGKNQLSIINCTSVDLTGFKWVCGTVMYSAQTFSLSAKSITFGFAEFIQPRMSIAYYNQVTLQYGMSNSVIKDVLLTRVIFSTQVPHNYTTFKNIDYLDNTLSNTVSNTATKIIDTGTSTGCVLDNITYGRFGTYPITSSQGFVAGSSLTLRNIGTAAQPIVNPAGTYKLSQLNNSITNASDSFRAQRIYINSIATFVAGDNFRPGQTVTYESVWLGDSVSSCPTGSSDCDALQIYKGCYCRTTATLSTPSASKSGNHWGDYFDTLAGTTGMLTFVANNMSASSSYMYTELTGGYYNKSGTGGWYINNADKVYFEMPYRMLGHTGFQNVAPVVTWSGNVGVVYYQIDTGTGYNGTWKLLNAANLSAETVNPAGTKLRFYATGATSTYTTFQNVKIYTNSTQAARAANLYPLDQATFALTGLQPGSEVRCFAGTDEATSVEIGGTESSGTSFSFTHSYGGQVGYIQVISLGYKDVFISNFTYPSADYSLPVQQELDRNYSNP